ncbi:transposase [Anaeromyxobacter sp. PSR-1]|uniref:transposase n=1 Tax=Anaeromyxobacter sp. PSR-1 TaxID=1300915 RepID=UPI0018729D93|nr:transposase [Anaeromyxobacter sp. PSR-1]
MMRGSRQLRFRLPPPRTHGGRRAGAGRKPKGARAGVSHHGRPAVTASTPAHVTLRVLPHVWNLRSQRSLRVVEAALEAAAAACAAFRVVHFALEGNHLHLLVEADGQRALSSGMQGLCIRLAKGLNRMMGRRGKVFADRYHARVLGTPSEVRNALAYVLLNHRSHLARLGKPAGRGGVDRFSSGRWFDGWRGGGPGVPDGARRVTAAPRTWLLRTGWRRGSTGSPRAARGPISLDEVPPAVGG